MPHVEGALERMFQHQAEMQVRSFGGVHPHDLGLEEKIQFLKDMTLALEDELHESMQEYGWKPWSKKRFIDVDPLKGELVDAWHFFMNLCIAVGMSPEELTDRYFNKAEVNRARQEAGYDNTNKCEVCRRALDEPKDHHPSVTRISSSGRLVSEDYVRDLLESEREERATEQLEAMQGVLTPLQHDELEQPSRLVHNHMTRIILAPGECPACDATHQAEREHLYSPEKFVANVLKAARHQISEMAGEDPPVIEVALEHLASLDQYINLDPDVSIDAAGGVVFGVPSDDSQDSPQSEQPEEGTP